MDLSHITGIITIVLGLCLLITIHELGHWLVARLFGFQTPVFSIGFGSRKYSLVLGRFWETEFRLAPILAGGYVSIPELQDETDETGATGDKTGAPPKKIFPVWQRICVSAAGVVFNVISAAMMVWALLVFIGMPTMQVSSTSVKGLDTTSTYTYARDAGLQAGDRFVSVDGKTIVKPEDLVQALKARSGQSARVVVERQGKQVSTQVTTSADGRIGIQIGVDGKVVHERVGPVQAIGQATSVTGNLIVGTVKGFGMMLHLVDRPPQISDQDMEVRGIVGIVQMGAGAVDTGVFDFVWFLVVISINLAVMNILPLPILDGGHIVFALLEKVRGKPLSPQTRGKLFQIFGMLLLGLFLLGFFNDVKHIVGG